jgi:hypothetical protein
MAMTCLLAALALARSASSHIACGPSALQLIWVVLPHAQFRAMTCQLPTSKEYQPPLSDMVFPPAASISASRAFQYWR